MDAVLQANKVRMLLEYYWRKKRYKRLLRKKRKYMPFFFLLISLVAAVGFFLSGTVYALSRFFGALSLNPQSNAWKRTIQRLRDHVRKQSDQVLVPWDAEMLGLLSTKLAKVKKSGFFDPVSSGMFTTIYQEPVVGYAGIQSGNTAILVAKTSDREFVYRQKGTETEIWLNGQPLGLLVGDTMLAPGRGSKLLARLDTAAGAHTIPVLMGDKTAAGMRNSDADGGPNPRALTLLRPLQAEEENALLALSLWKMLHKS